MSNKRISKTKKPYKKKKSTTQTVKKKSSYYEYWKKQGKTTWIHIPSGQTVEITNKSLDELGYYNVDCFFKGKLDYVNIGFFKSFEDARKSAVNFVNRNDNSESPY